jgi:alpha-1,2-mannosyltransferase
MYTTAVAMAYALEPASLNNYRRTLAATLYFALGAIIGWPFALAISIPFVLEELFIFGGDKVAPEIKANWFMQRCWGFFTAFLTASLIFVSHITTTQHES